MTDKRYIVLGVVIIVCIAAITAATIRRNDRYRHNVKVPQEYVDRLHDIPLEVEGWTLYKSPEEEEGEDPLQRERSGVADVFQRRYINDKGEVVTIYIAVGQGFHLAEHIPQRCYTAIGFKEMSDVEQFDVPLDAIDPENTLESVTTIFERNHPTKGIERIRLFWSFYLVDQEKWVGEFLPMKFVTKPVIYKFYLTSSAPYNQQPPDENYAYDFAKAYFPMMKKAVDGDLAYLRKEKKESEQGKESEGSDKEKQTPEKNSE